MLAADLHVVTTLEDVVDFKDGYRSLREALIVAAEDGSTTDNEVITFDAKLFEEGAGTLTLVDHDGNGVADQLLIDQNIIIVGPGADLLSIDGAGQTRSFAVRSGASLMLHGLTIENGFSEGYGGGVLSEGDLTLDSVVLRDNRSGWKGGGIYSAAGNLYVTSSTIEANESEYGGGIFRQTVADASTVIDSSTFYRNRAVADKNVHTGLGGAMVIGGSDMHSVEIVNSTFSGNEAVKGAALKIYDGPSVEIVHSTITENYAVMLGESNPSSKSVRAGGIDLQVDNRLVLRNSVIAGNYSAGSYYYNNIFGKVNAANSHNNVVVTGQGTGGVATSNNFRLQSGDELLLMPLGDYGGPTMTHLPMEGSPVIDRAAPLTGNDRASDDQRKTARETQSLLFSLGGPDIGAVEYARPTHRVTIDSVVPLNIKITDTDAEDVTILGSRKVAGVDLITINGSYTLNVNGLPGTLPASLINHITVDGGSGNDLIDLSGIDSSIFTSLLDNGDAPSTLLIGGRGDDHVIGSALNDVLGNRTDRVTGESDVLQGGRGDDQYVFGGDNVGGTDRVVEFDGEGNDTLSYENAWLDSSRSFGLLVSFNLSYLVYDYVDQAHTLEAHAGENFLENIIGTSLRDIIYGNASANVIDGRGGNDYIEAGAGNDTLIGGTGDDYLIGASGNDTYVFSGDENLGSDVIFERMSDGNDTLDFRQLDQPGGLSVYLDNDGTGERIVDEAFLKLSYSSSGMDQEIEAVIGSPYDDTLVGNDLDNQLFGMDGNDTLVGGLGNDLLLPGPGQTSDNGEIDLLPPTGVQLTSEGELTWNLPTGIGVASVDVLRSRTGLGDWEVVDSVSSNSDHVEVDRGEETFFYAVQVRTALGISALSDVVETVDVFDDRAVKMFATAGRDELEISWLVEHHNLGGTYKIYRRGLDELIWHEMGSVSASSHQEGVATWVDDSNEIALGTAFEYRILRVGTQTVAQGFLYGAVERHVVESRGTVVLVVDEEIEQPLAAEIARLRQDLIGDGWLVEQVRAKRDPAGTGIPEDSGEAVAAVKASIQSIYDQRLADSNPDNDVKAVFLLGNVPVPYSGSHSPEGHSERSLAADTFYGDMDGVWTDTIDFDFGETNDSYGDRNYMKTNSTRTDYADRSVSNVAGDGRFDQDRVPGDGIVELQVGRVDLSRMSEYEPDFPGQSFESDLELEIALLKRYLDKDHAYRHGEFDVPDVALVMNSKANTETRTSEIRNFSALLGRDAVSVDTDWLTNSGDPAYAALFGSVAGTSQTHQNIYTLNGYQSAWRTTTNTVFNTLSGSYLVDWNKDGNLLRQLLANDGFGLTAQWNYVESNMSLKLTSMGMGETIGYANQDSQNIFLAESYPAHQKAYTWRDLMGDPTLRMDVVAPATNVNVTTNGNKLTVQWTGSADSGAQGFAGYYIYAADSYDDPFERVTNIGTSGGLVTGTSATISGADPDKVYMVRAVKLESTNSGSYYNASQGAFSEAI